MTWPALLPVTFYLAIVNAIAASQVFTPSYVLTRGGPDDATLTTALYTFQTAFAYGKLGYGAAMAIVVFVAVLRADRASRSGSSGVACRTSGPSRERPLAGDPRGRRRHPVRRCRSSGW